MNKYFENKNVLITGGCGFLGSNLALELVHQRAKVTIVDNLIPLYGGNEFNLAGIKDDIKLIFGDMCDMVLMEPLIEETDILYHLGAQVSYIDSINIPYTDLDYNAKSTLLILECCRKKNLACKIVFSSSRMVYGKIFSDFVNEDSPTNPLSLYGIHKLTSEKYLSMYYKDFGIKSIILRIANPYGPRQQIKHSKYSLVGWFIRQAMEDKEIKIYGSGSQLRDYIYVDDIVSAMILCAMSDDADGEILNIGSGISYEFCEMVREVVECVKKGNVINVPWPSDYENIETGDVKLDISRLKSLTGWEPIVSLTEGIRRTHEYYNNFFSEYL